MKTRTFIVASLAIHARTITTPRPLIFRRACLWTGFLAFATIAFEPQPAPAAVTEAWVQRYGTETGSQDHAYKVVTDAAGNVIVAGTSMHNQTGSGSDMLVIKYSGAGVPLWTNRYDGRATAVAVDGSGNVFVTGTSATIAYSGAGAPLWTNHYNGSANAVAVDGSGNVFVTGNSAGTGGNSDYATIAYSGAGLPLWTNRYNGTGYGWDQAIAVAVSASGNVFVTGSSQSFRFRGDDYATIAYSGAGVPLWTNRYNGPADSDDYPNAVAVDASGNVFVTGASDSVSPGSGSSYDYTTIAYSGAGVPLWTRRYNGPGNGSDEAKAVAVDGSGNVFVTGTSATIAYSGAGAPLWTRYSGSANAVAVDGSGNVFVTGSSDGDSATIAYSGAGVPLWTNRYNGPANGYYQAYAVAMDGSGNVFVTGSSVGSGGDSDFATIAYSGAGVALWTNRYGGRGADWDIANAVAVDGTGNVFVTGSSGGDYATIAYSGAGVPLWTNRYYNGAATAVAVDGSGNVFVTGNSGGDYATIAYSGAGVPLWTNRYDGPSNGNDEARAVAVDASGNVFVTGSSDGSGGSWDYATIAYSGVGVPLWTNRYDDLSDQADAVAVDGSGNVFVTGTSRDVAPDYVTIAYSGTGIPLWTNRYGPFHFRDVHATALAVDGSGNVFVTGSSATIAYSGAGVPLWTNGGGAAIAVDGSGNVFVTGNSTIKYSGAGVPLWTNYNVWASALAVDGSGNVFVTETSYGSGGNFDYATIAYSGAGVPLWTNLYYSAVLPKPSLAIGSDGAVYVTGASDGDFVTVKYVWQTEIAIQLLSTIPPTVNLMLSGAPNSSWAIERALEPAGPWTNLNTLVIGPNGSAQFQDANSPSPAGFYRARQPVFRPKGA